MPEPENPVYPPGLAYPWAYWIGVAITAVLAIIAAISLGWNSGQGAALGLSPQAYALISLIGVALGVIGRAFPNVQYTPGTRDKEFSDAVNHLRLPKDVRIPPRTGI